MTQAVYTPVTHDDDEYWTHDIPLFVGTFPSYRNKPRMVQGRVHVSEERFSNSSVNEIIPLSTKKGIRQYINMQPYVLEPEVFMTVGMYPKPKQYADQDEAIGEVLSTRVKGMRQHQIGNSQAWYYPTDTTIVLWECYFYPDMRNKPLPEDKHMQNLWHGFENWLYKQFPDATRIVTPFNDPIAKSIEEYQSFLRSLGYAPIAQAAYGKQIPR